MDIRPFIVFAGAGACLWAIGHWRQAFHAVMLLLVLEGALRKWFFQGGQDLIYLAKDVLLFSVYIGYVRERVSQRIKPPELPILYGALGAGAVLGLFEVFNPNLPNVLVGVLGFKAYFLYVPLIFLVPAVFPTDQALSTFIRRYILLSIPVGLLALAQFFSPPSSMLNTYARGDESGTFDYISTFGSSEYVRVTATFSYITGYSSYLVGMTILILAYLAATRWRLRPSLAAYSALTGAMLGMLMTGSRGPVFMMALLFPIYWWLAVVRGAEGGATFARFLFGLSLLGILVSSVAPEAVSAFRGRAAAGSEDVASRIWTPFTAPWDALPDAGPFGFGIGATHQTAAAVTQGIIPYSWLHGLAIEVESGRVMLELGPIGFLLVYFVRIYMIAFSLRQVFVLRTTFHRALATGCLLFFLAQLAGNVVFDVTSDLFYWFFGGLLLAAVRLDSVAVRKAAAPGPDHAETTEKQAPGLGPRRVPNRRPLLRPQA